MSGTVPILSIYCMSITCLISIALPIGLFLYFRAFKGADIFPYFVGCAVMLLFVFFLESAAHSAILYSEAGAVIRNNIALYALYGGIMAGLFEETGRLLAFKTVLKKYQVKDQNALIYGAGHGGFESISLVGATMVTNLVWSYAINLRNTVILTDNLSGDAFAQAEAAIQSLITTPSYMFLMAGIERAFAIVLHIALSVLVWFAAKEKGRMYLYLLAVFLHFAIDATGVALSGFNVNTILIEVVVAVFTAVTVLIARRIWKSCQYSPTPEAERSSTPEVEIAEVGIVSALYTDSKPEDYDL